MDLIFELLDFSSSQDEFDIILAFVVAEEQLRNERGSTSYHGSIQRYTFITHNSLEGNQRLFFDYFAKSPVYALNVFRRRFRTHILCFSIFNMK